MACQQVGRGGADIRARRDDEKQVRILNRILTWGTNGIEHEADQTYAAVLASQNLTSTDRPVSTLGEDMNDNVNDPDMDALEKKKSF